MIARIFALLSELAGSILPVLLLLIFFQGVVLRRPFPNGPTLLFGGFLAAFGLLALVHGLRITMQPLGETVSAGLVEARNVPLFLLFALLLGFSVTLAEPSLITLARQVEELTSGALGRGLFTFAVASGVALGTAVGTVRILFGLEATPFFIPALAIVLSLTYFAPERYTALAFDAAMATTGPFTVALFLGIAAALGRSDALLFGFGILTMAGLGTIISVLLLGITLGLLGR